jgi:hypothetical protein
MSSELPGSFCSHYDQVLDKLPLDLPPFSEASNEDPSPQTKGSRLKCTFANSTSSPQLVRDNKRSKVAGKYCCRWISGETSNGAIDPNYPDAKCLFAETIFTNTPHTMSSADGQAAPHLQSPQLLLSK